MDYRFVVSVSSPEFAKITRMMGLVFKDEWGVAKKELVHSVPVEGSRDEPLTDEELDEMVASYPWGEFDKVLQIQERVGHDWQDLRSVMRG